MQTQEYYIVTGCDPEGVVSDVNHLMRGGWVAIGGVSVADATDGYNEYSQALVRDVPRIGDDDGV